MKNRDSARGQFPNDFGMEFCAVSTVCEGKLTFVAEDVSVSAEHRTSFPRVRVNSRLMVQNHF